MLDLKIKFNILGLIIFILPMLINILYFITPHHSAENVVGGTYKGLESIEQVTRILYAIAICFLVSNKHIDFKSPYLYVGIVFLVLYDMVWIRYFTGGMEQSLLAKSFLGIPLPLALFPVLYFICAAMWMKNSVAVVLMIIFGIAHSMISYMTLKF